MITEFLIKWWELIIVGFLVLNLIIQKIEKIKGNSDILTGIWKVLTWIVSFVRQIIAMLFSTIPGKLPMLFIGFFLMSFLLVGQAFANVEVTFEWDSNTESDMAYYNVYRSDDNQITWHKVNPDPISHTGMGTETWTEMDVPDGSYAWYATAVDLGNHESDPSNIITRTIDEAPAPPQNFIIALIQKIIAWIMNLFKSFGFA